MLNILDLCTLLPYNRSEMSWDQVQLHLQDVWNSSHLAISIDTLLSQISAISHCRLQITSAEGLASYFINSVKIFVQNSFLWNFLINLGIIGGLNIFLLPVIFKCLRSKVQSAQREVNMLNLI